MADTTEKKDSITGPVIGMCVSICVAFLGYQLLIANICGSGYQAPHSVSSIVTDIGLGLLILSAIAFIGCLIAVIAILFSRLP